MVKNDKTLIKAQMAIRQAQIVASVDPQLRLRKTLQIVTPETKTATKRERQIDLVQQFVSVEKTLQDAPGIAEGDVLRTRIAGLGDFTTRPEGTECEERTCPNVRITRPRRIASPASQQNSALPASQCLNESFGRMRCRNLLDDGAHDRSHQPL
jgi:hypothetical protein